MIRVWRTKESPSSLLSGSQYDSQDVKDALNHDFDQKCYLCERYIRGQYEIEHLRPKKIYPHLRCQWNNLFLVCRNCNGIKGERFPDTIIDCCEDDPERLIEQKVHKGKIIIKAKRVHSVNKQEAAKDTAALIHECFYGRTPKNDAEKLDKYMTLRKSDKCGELQAEVKLAIISLCNALCDYRSLKKQGKDYSSELRRIRRMLNRSGEYACFMRSFVRDRLDIFPEFREYVAVDSQNAEINGVESVGGNR